MAPFIREIERQTIIVRKSPPFPPPTRLVTRSVIYFCLCHQLFVCISDESLLVEILHFRACPNAEVIICCY